MLARTEGGKEGGETRDFMLHRCDTESIAPEENTGGGEERGGETCPIGNTT
jgi:hypothetical protein